MYIVLLLQFCVINFDCSESFYNIGFQKQCLQNDNARTIKHITFLFSKKNLISIALNNGDQFFVKSGKQSYCDNKTSSICNVLYIKNALPNNDYIDFANQKNNDFVIECYKRQYDDCYYVIVRHKQESLDYSLLLNTMKVREKVRNCCSNKDCIGVLDAYNTKNYRVNCDTFEQLQLHLDNKLTQCSVAEVFGSENNVEVVVNDTKYIASSDGNLANASQCMQNDKQEQDTYSEKHKSSSATLSNDSSSNSSSCKDNRSHVEKDNFAQIQYQ